MPDMLATLPCSATALFEPFLLDGTAAAFLPLGLRGPAPSYPVALVDAGPGGSNISALRLSNWRVSNTGLVFRFFYDIVNSNLEHRNVKAREVLARRVLDISCAAPWHTVSGDRLDLRARNLSSAPVLAARWVEPGSTLRGIPGYGDIIASRSGRDGEIARESLRPGIKSCVPQTRMRALLDGIITDPALTGQGTHTPTVAEIREYIRAETGIWFTPSYIYAILAGKSLRVPGYDYAKLRASRPSRSDVARAREAKRREYELERRVAASSIYTVV